MILTLIGEVTDKNILILINIVVYFWSSNVHEKILGYQTMWRHADLILSKYQR